MALYYVVPAGYTGTVPAGYTQLTVNDPLIGNDNFSVNSGDTYMMSSALSGTINITPSSTSYDQATGTQFIVEGGNASTMTMNFDTTSFRPDIVANITVPDGADASKVSIDAQDTDGMTLTVGDNAKLGNIAGGTDSTDADSITTGAGSTVGNIDTNDGADSVTIGGTAGTIVTEGGADTVTLLSGASVGSVDTGTGNDLISFTGANVTGEVNAGSGDDNVTLSNSTIGGAVLGGSGADKVTITNTSITEQLSTANADGVDTSADTLTVTDSTIGKWIDTGGGNDRATITGATSIGDDGIVSLNMGSGDDSLVLGPSVTYAENIRGDSGNDTISVIAANKAELTLLNTVLNSEGFATTAGNTAPVAYNFGTDDDGLIYEFDWKGSWFSEWENAAAVCFARGTMIVTDRGERAIEDLTAGDLVMTRDNGLQPIRWMGCRKLSAAELSAAPQLRPIRISAGALGAGIPATDLTVSPQHRVLVRSRIAQKMFGAPEVLVAAKQLVQVPGIDIADDMSQVEYFHMLFDGHEVVISNGAETESLYTGPEALKSLGSAALEEIFTIFPELEDRDYAPVAARVLASGRMGRKLAVRHAQNSKALVM